MKTGSFILLLLLTVLQISAQINENERLVYAASYNMSGLMTHLAQVTMETKKVSTSKNTFLHFKMNISTFSKWDSYFRIRDVYETYVNPTTLAPSLFRRDTNEGGYTIVEKYTYQAGGTTVNSTVRKGKGEERNNTFNKKATAVDIVALLYQLRMVDFSQYKAGQMLPVLLLFDEKEVSAQIKYMGKETISVGKLGKKECYKLSLAAKTDVLKGKDKNLIWLTADDRRVPAFAQFSIPVGTGQLELTEMN